MGRVRIRKAFTLVELMIVVSILGILGAIVLPAFGNHIQQAKEAAAKDNLRILRNAINIYAAQHNDVPPGYANDDSTATPSYAFFHLQMITNNTYLSDLPENPITDVAAIKVLLSNETVPAAAAITESFGWFYQPSTKTIKLNASGNDSTGTLYYDY